MLTQSFQYQNLCQVVDSARREIVHGNIEVASKRVYELISVLTQQEPVTFEQKDIELLPAYFLLAEANICMGGSRLGKAEEFLIAAYWNLLNSKNADETDGERKCIVSDQELDHFRGTLHKTFGRLFLSVKEDPTYRKALEELTKGIVLECQQHGPESYRMSSSYFYLGETFRKQGQAMHNNTKAIFGNIVQIWKRFILEQDMQPGADWKYSQIEPIYYEEAEQHFRSMIHFLESEYGAHETVTAECLFAYALVSLKIGNDVNAFDAMRKAHMVLSNNLGEYDPKTKEVEEFYLALEGAFKQTDEE